MPPPLPFLCVRPSNLYCTCSELPLLLLQAQTFEHLLGGFDLVGRARTGCGKTLAFVLPIVEKLKETMGPNGRRPFGRTPSVIVLLPTRELAKQVGLSQTVCAARVSVLLLQQLLQSLSDSFHHNESRKGLLRRATPWSSTGIVEGT